MITKEPKFKILFACKEYVYNMLITTTSNIEIASSLVLLIWVYNCYFFSFRILIFRMEIIDLTNDNDYTSSLTDISNQLYIRRVDIEVSFLNQQPTTNLLIPYEKNSRERHKNIGINKTPRTTLKWITTSMPNFSTIYDKRHHRDQSIDYLADRVRLRTSQGPLWQKKIV